MQKREANFGETFRHWIRKNPYFTCGIETKQTTTNSIPFSCVDEEQINYAMAVKSKQGVLIRTDGVKGLPDFIYMREEPSFVIIRFPKRFHIIDIETFVHERDKSKRKSLTDERASEISVKTVRLQKGKGDST